MEFIVLGAGLVGTAAALALAQKGHAVTLVDARAPRGWTAPPPPLFDARIYALSAGTQTLLQSLGAWEALDASRIAPVTRMRIAEAQGRGTTHLELPPNQSALCWMAEEGHLMGVLEKLAENTPNLVRRTASVASMRETGGNTPRVVLSLEDGSTLEADFLLGADGARSWVRQALGIAVDWTSYGQEAVVANFETTLPHAGTAYQWFGSGLAAGEQGAVPGQRSALSTTTRAPTGNGVLAYLPLPGNRMSMVWSLPTSEAEPLMAMDETAFCDAVAQAGQSTLGALKRVGAAARYPLTNVRAHALAAGQVALLGDAAHVVHPMAGQGVNLGFQDVACFAGLALDDATTLGARYARARAKDILALHSVTHGLFGLFSNAWPVVRQARGAGMNLLDKVPLLKQWLVREAAR
jgi:2-polyprenylphenol 6-hydroxylase